MHVYTRKLERGTEEDKIGQWRKEARLMEHIHGNRIILLGVEGYHRDRRVRKKEGSTETNVCHNKNRVLSVSNT